MDEYRQALQRLVNAIQFCERPALIQEARVLEPAIDAAKALLARGEPQCVDGLDGRGEMLDLAEKARALALRNDERRRLKLTSKQLMMEPEQFLAFVKYCESLEPAAADHPAIDLVRKQACDAGLWFSPVTAAEAYLQQELRRLHAAIESQPAAAEKASAFLAWLESEEGRKASSDADARASDTRALLEKGSEIDPMKLFEPFTAEAEKARERYQEGDVLLFIGWLSGDIAELRKVEVPRLADSWRRFKEALTSPPASKVEAEKAREWRPIDTAPTNGKWIQLWWPGVTDVPFTGYCVDGVWRAATSGDSWPSIAGPTHWQDLPAPPAATGETCIHDLQLPNHTIKVHGPQHAECKVCKQEWWIGLPTSSVMDGGQP